MENGIFITASRSGPDRYLTSSSTMRETSSRIISEIWSKKCSLGVPHCFVDLAFRTTQTHELLRIGKMGPHTSLGIISSFSRHPDFWLHLLIKTACYTGTASYQGNRRVFSDTSYVVITGLFLFAFLGKVL